MKTDGLSKFLRFMRVKGIRIILLIFLLLLIGCSYYAYHQLEVFNSIKITINEEVAIEYGSPNYDIHDFIK